ncbi:helix-turn-helix domain-containing protein [Methylobacterium isbiliense]|jgi:AraC-like DNA-binding protein|uniref:HTH-type transcriptional regulator NimR n=1 Tax=Methylobacterium isbiliense TaxID=315478 RepID=A0ABQ4SB14_9HYPH|nr:helix-turn-helix transcriptional regulator [Methylobacterium isbiliense]MDN3626000.1 helix-turn-helix transcriptional regulator [Methylobacterium isbiliense]GJD99640.1 HTH-type transcriptional regulator NimR [Methylobacterium isbiliense]
MRSERAADYQDVPRRLAVMPKTYPAGSTTGLHSHPRAQLLYATAGLMVAGTALGTWVVPSGHALWIPPGVLHDVTMCGPVAMSSAYIAVDGTEAAQTPCRVLRVSRLLAAALAAIAEEPVLYDEAGRGGLLAALVLDEIMRAPETPLALPMPQDPRLRRVCAQIVADPRAPGDLDAWAGLAGASRRTLTRRFRAETGLSFGAWRTRARMARALALAAEGTAPRAVAAAVGYANPQVLHGVMRRTLGS